MRSGKDRSVKGPLFLLAASVIWGFSLVTQQTGMAYLGPWSFTAVRCALGGLSMIPLTAILDKKRKLRENDFDPLPDTKSSIIPGIICGFALLGTILCQQYGLLYTSVGKASFITAFYIFLTPLTAVFFGEKISGKIWLSVVIAMAGLAMITLSGGVDAINRGDIWMLGAALCYTMFIHLGYRFAGSCNPVKIGCIQSLTIGLCAFIGVIFFERDSISIQACLLSWFPIVWAGIVSCAGGYTLQLLGQKDTDPSVAALILSSEIVISLFAGWLFLHERLSGIEYLGCAVMVAAILISLRRNE